MKCPNCGDEKAYVGLNNVECVKRSCKHFSEKWWREQAFGDIDTIPLGLVKPGRLTVSDLNSVLKKALPEGPVRGRRCGKPMQKCHVTACGGSYHCIGCGYTTYCLAIDSLCTRMLTDEE